MHLRLTALALAASLVTLPAMAQQQGAEHDSHHPGQQTVQSPSPAMPEAAPRSPSGPSQSAPDMRPGEGRGQGMMGQGMMGQGMMGQGMMGPNMMGQGMMGQGSQTEMGQAGMGMMNCPMMRGGMHGMSSGMGSGLGAGMGMGNRMGMGNGMGMGMSQPAGDESVASLAFAAVNARMHRDMAIAFTGKADADFVKAMIAHHQGAIDMAKVVRAFGEDAQIRALAEEIIETQEDEITMMRDWLAQNAQ